MLPSTRSWFLSILLSTRLVHTTTSNPVFCYFQSPAVQILPDCLAAIDLIPSRADFVFDPAFPGDRDDQPDPIHLQLTTPSHQRRHLLPAAFHSGSCVVLVASTTRNPSRLNELRPPPAVKAASAMHLTVWPKAKSHAEDIVKHCCLTGNRWFSSQAGEAETSVDLERWPFSFRITVRGTPEGLTAGKGKVKIRGGNRAEPWEELFHVYEADSGGSSGRNGGV